MFYTNILKSSSSTTSNLISPNNKYGKICTCRLVICLLKDIHLVATIIPMFWETVTATNVLVNRQISTVYNVYYKKYTFSGHCLGSLLTEGLHWTLTNDYHW